MPSESTRRLSISSSELKSSSSKVDRDIVDRECEWDLQVVERSASVNDLTLVRLLL